MKIMSLVSLLIVISPIAGLFGDSACDADVAKSCCKGPSVVKHIDPVLPENFLNEGETAEILVRCAINEKGELVGVKSIKATRDDLEKIVIAAIKQWEFNASTHMGEPQRATLNIPFKFTLASK